ncbi:cytochrome c oxidase assembly protein [Pseudemcibacter aquimaris]|uniref:cytochrome c oxidase assembly protein n=1 Tax=Pseudemcibacter aquimaris TaxID=2857064 RepID=UPI00201160F7|nr:cytochrome c oxidase assembly protein [Pseudemcibacter aquimaris]MCC3862463.1 cytochrome c oxidase assembly protein [Pseudemcibacter aquimaris]WDU59109.1 cytochrome c oxidase assembly protein [Pseudemcibacter aquimaris]
MSVPANQSNVHTKTLILTLGIVFGMAILVAASVPLYQMLCQVTGIGGTTNQAEYAPDVILDREVTVLFNSDINGNLPWKFKPVQRRVKVKVGEEALVFYKAINESDKPITGVATYNVTPFKTAYYFNKIECFCFTEQTLQPGEEVDMAISFYIDPEFVEDEDVDEIKELTLSYTFFPVDDYNKQFE